MKTKLILAAVLGLGLMFLVSCNMVEQPPVEVASANKSVMIVETPTQSKNAPLNGEALTQTAVTQQPEYPVSIESNAYASVLSDLLAKAGDAANAYKAGWLVQKSSKESELPGDNGTLPNGTVIPEAYDMETWLNLDENGYIIQSVAIMTGLDGQMIQVGIQDHDKGWNTATETQTAVPPQLFTIRWENPLREILAQLETEAMTMTRDILPDGMEVMVCKVFTFFPQPLKVNGSEDEVTSSETQYIIDARNGQILQIDVYSTTVDGENIKVQSMRYSLFEPAETPTAEILGYLELIK